MILADTSVVVEGLQSGGAQFWAMLGAHYPDAGAWAIALPTRMEVLMGARNSREREKLERHLDRWKILPIRLDDWDEAARIYSDLRQIGVTTGAMDCCIAQTALSHDALLLHRDRDFDFIAKIRPALRAEQIPFFPRH